MESSVENVLNESLPSQDDKFRKNEVLFMQVFQRIEIAEVRIENIQKGVKQSKEGSRSEPDSEKIRDMDKRIKATHALIETHKEEVAKSVQEVRDHLFPKAERTELEDTETRIVDKFNELVEALYKRFADRGDTKKSIKVLERQLKNMYELFITQAKKDAQPPEEDDAMLTRKPLHGWTCVSCERNLTNYYG